MAEAPPRRLLIQEPFPARHRSGEGGTSVAEQTGGGVDPKVVRSERVTMLTDFLLALVAGSLAIALVLQTEWGVGAAAPLWWAATFLFTAAGAVTGGVFHGTRHVVAAATAERLWTVTLLLSAAVGFCLVAVAAWMVPDGPVRWSLLAVAGAKLVIVVALLRQSGSFAVVAWDSGLSLLLLGAVAVRALALQGGQGGGWWIVTGVGLSLAGAAIQQGKFRQDRVFDHNDLFHLVQTAACLLFYLGAGRG